MFYIIMTKQSYTMHITIINNKSNCFNVRIYSLKKSFIDIYIKKMHRLPIINRFSVHHYYSKDTFKTKLA